MNAKTQRWRRLKPWAPALGSLAIMLIALSMDMLGDRSFGLVMVATIPVALVAMGCLLIGPFVSASGQRRALGNWLASAGLVLTMALMFYSRGAEQAKDGELIATYACLLMSFPASLTLPFAMDWGEPLLQGRRFLALFVMWGFCVAAGGILWMLLTALRRHFVRR